MPPKNDPLKLQPGVQKPKKQRQNQNRTIEAPQTETATTKEIDNYEPPKELIRTLEGMKRWKLQKLLTAIDYDKACTLNEILKDRCGLARKGFRGYKLEQFNNRNPEKMKKSVVDEVSKIKQKLQNAGKREWAEQLRVSSLKDSMSSVRKFAEHIQKTHPKSDFPLDKYYRNVRHLTNWSCHAESGWNPFIVTPDNQREAVSNLDSMLKLLLPSDRYVLE